MADELRFDTRLVHAGEPRLEGSVVTPVFQSATFLYEGSGTGYHDLRYVRLNNTPGHDALHAKLASLEGAEAALVTSSGMAAISTALLTVLRAGDHVLVQEGVYGGTHELCRHDLPELGIEVDFVPGDDPSAWARRRRPSTRAFYLETLTNPLLRVPDVGVAVAFAREHGLTTLIDNTFASPVNYRPLEHGIDLVLHSATKYLNGHTDLAAGVVAGSRELVERVRHRLNHLGGVLDPHACFLLGRGLKTLGVRVRHQNAAALTLARSLSGNPAVASVHHPLLDTHPDHVRARETLAGTGGMLSFDVAEDASVDRFLAALSVPLVAPSLGGVETLVSLPARTSHAGLSEADRGRLGIGESLVRVSVGLEDVRDLVEDFDRALTASRR